MNYRFLSYISFAIFLSFFFTYYFVPLFLRAAKKLGIIDYPDGNLKIHKNPTPYLGGVAIYLGFISTLSIVYPFENQMFLFLVGSTVLLFVGLLDDLISINPSEKFFGQIIATFCFLKAGFYLKEQFLSNFYNIFISFFWILTIINAFNLVDIMDGLATIIALLSTIGFLICAIFFNNFLVALLLSSFLGALFAFLLFNKPEARIYLGDAGSCFIGGFLATVPFMLPWGTYTIYGFITPIIILLIPLLEVGTLILIRTYKRIPFYQGSPDHFAIYLQRNGWSKFQILTYISIVSIFLILLAFFVVAYFINIFVASILMLIFIIFWYLVLSKQKNSIF